MVKEKVPLKKAKRKSKYGAKKTVVDGIIFDSLTESKYYLFLKLAKKRGKIKHFDMQPVYELQPRYEHPTRLTKAGKKSLIAAIKFTPDFLITLNDDTQKVVDIKGNLNNDMLRDFRLRGKIFMHVHQLPLFIVTYDRKTGLFMETDV